MPITRGELEKYEKEQQKLVEEIKKLFKDNPDSAYTSKEVYKAVEAKFPRSFKNLTERQKEIWMIEMLSHIRTTCDFLERKDFKGISYHILKK